MGIIFVTICDGCGVQVPPDENVYSVFIELGTERTEKRKTRFMVCLKCAGGSGHLTDLFDTYYVKGRKV